MRRIAWLGGMAILVACKRTPPPAAREGAAEAGATLVKADPIVPAPEDAGPAAKQAPPLPLADSGLELVAVGKRWTSKLISLEALGDRVWLSGVDVDAYADGDGPLTKGPDVL